jgi:hypothetical protein
MLELCLRLAPKENFLLNIIRRSERDLKRESLLLSDCHLIITNVNLKPCYGLNVPHTQLHSCVEI